MTIEDFCVTSRGKIIVFDECCCCIMQQRIYLAQGVMSSDNIRNSLLLFEICIFDFARYMIDCCGFRRRKSLAYTCKQKNEVSSFEFPNLYNIYNIYTAVIVRNPSRAQSEDSIQKSFSHIPFDRRYIAIYISNNPLRTAPSASQQQPPIFSCVYIHRSVLSLYNTR